MNTIVVGIDFSKKSINELKFAIALANLLDAHIRLVWVNKETFFDVFSKPSNLSKEELVEQKMEELIDKFKRGILSNGGIFKGELLNKEFSYVIRSGEVSKQIALEASEQEAELVILSTSKVEGIATYYFGDDAYKTLFETNADVLTVRSDKCLHLPIQRIIVPIDSTPETRHKMPQIIKLAKRFGAKLYLLGLCSSNSTIISNAVKSYVKQVAEVLDKQAIPYEKEIIQTQNIAKDTLVYATEKQGHLIAIMTEQESSPKNIIIGSYTQQLIRLSSIPILCVHAKETSNVHFGY